MYKCGKQNTKTENDRFKDYIKIIKILRHSFASGMCNCATGIPSYPHLNGYGIDVHTAVFCPHGQKTRDAEEWNADGLWIKGATAASQRQKRLSDPLEDSGTCIPLHHNLFILNLCSRDGHICKAG